MKIEYLQHDDVLGRWTLARSEPESLRGLVQGVWHFEGTLTRRRERHFPRGILELIVHLGPAYRQVDRGGSTRSFSTTCFTGIQLQPDVVEAPDGHSAVLGIRLTPAGAAALLSGPLHELTGHTVDLADLLPEVKDELLGPLLEARTVEDRIRQAAVWAASRIRAAERPDPAIVWAAREIERASGRLSIKQLRERSGSSRTRFTQAFKETVGVPPKTFARLVRFQAALERLNGQETPLVEIALRAGYYDQPHFNADFKELSGFTPTEYLRELRYPAGVSVAHPTP